MRFGLFGIAVLAGTFSLTSHASAQLSPQWGTCTGKAGVDWEEQVKSCTVLIESPFETTDHRVLGYIRRGIAYNNQGKFDSALTDYEEAINLNPKSVQAYYNRGNAYWDKGEDDRAIADFDMAIKLDPKNVAAYRSRGLAFLYSNQLPKALTDVTEAAKHDPKDPYNALWADIVGQRSNVPSQLLQATAQINMTAWPAPVIRMFLGQTTPASVLAAAESADGKAKKGEVCEANFYSGEYALRKGTKEDAARLFKLAASECPRDFLEWNAANAELKTLGVAL